MSFVNFLVNKTSPALTEAVDNLHVDMRAIWRWHGDQEKGYQGVFAEDAISSLCRHRSKR